MNRTPGRTELLERWTELTRRTLPSMAASQAWPIRLDHCFMRICLDSAIGARWDAVVERSAVRHLTDAQLARAIEVAERIERQPSLLPALNRASLDFRRKPGS